MPPSVSVLEKEIGSKASRRQAAILQRFFKTGPGQYGAGDVFLGLKVPVQRTIAGRYANLARTDIQRLLSSPIHEFRLIALLILIEQYERAKTAAERKTAVDFYLKNTRRINNWDLVDLSAPKILGDFLFQTNASRSGRVLLLEKLVASSNLWERRIAIISTYAFIRAGRSAETFRLAERLLGDKHDLIHKAVGWMLREVGKRAGEPQLKRFLDRNLSRLPRTTLRYAIERLRPAERQRYLRA